MKLSLKPGCRANCFASFGPVYSLIGPIWTDFIKNPKIINYMVYDVHYSFCSSLPKTRAGAQGGKSRNNQDTT